MKKFIFVIVLIITATLFGREVKAEEEYCNLLDTNQIVYNEETNKFYSEQEFTFYKDEIYTFVARSNFFGNATKTKQNALSNKQIGIKAIGENDKIVPIFFKLTYSKSGLYYSTAKIVENCCVKFTNFLVEGYDIETLPKNEVILFKGTMKKFKGFRSPEYKDDFVKISDTFNIYTDCSNPISLETITSKIKFYDNEIGYNDVEVISNEYVEGCGEGEFKITLQAKDNSDNIKQLTVNVIVVDNEPPVITGPDVIEWDCYTVDPTPELALSNYTAYDNADGDITKLLKTSTPINWIFERGVTKDYEFEIVSRDKSGNESRKTIIIRAKDLYAPEVTLRDMNINLSGLGNYIFESNYNFVVDSVSDNSGNYSLSYKWQEVIGKTGFAGTFEVVVTATDAEGNKTVKTATIRVVDDIPPEFYVKSDLLNTTVDKVYTLEEIKNVISDELYSAGILYDSIELISCDYITNENTEGTYEVKYLYGYKGEVNYAVGTINVNEEIQEKSPIIFLLIIGVPLLIGIIYVIKKRTEIV